MSDLRVATCRPLPEPDPDEAPLLAALRARGLAVHLAAWHDVDEPWDAPIPTVLRSTWDYYQDLPAFLAWIQRTAAAAALWNPPDLVRWNVHKSYLAELAARRVPTVPTAFLPRGTAPDLAALARDLGSTDLILKPAVSASSFRTGRFDLADPAGAGAAATFLAALVADRDTLVQPYQAAVDTRGERSLVWIDGALTHAMRKSPRFAGGDEHVTGPFPMDDDERRLALAALEPFRDHLLYGRVDTIRGDDGVVRVMELELVEPSLFLAAFPPALARFVDALARRLG